MNDFAPRIDMMAADRVSAARPAQALAPVLASAATGASANQSDVGSDGGEQARREHMASVADYARVQARIADILADVDLGRADPAAARASAADRLDALRLPMVVIPLPPASVDAIERAVSLARDMAKQAALTRAAQANVQAGTIDQMFAITG